MITRIIAGILAYFRQEFVLLHLTRHGRRRIHITTTRLTLWLFYGLFVLPMLYHIFFEAGNAK
jgi:hypothetical protein